MEQYVVPRSLTRGMTIKGSTSGKLICRADVNSFALVMALVVFTVLACCMTTMGDHHHSALSIDLPQVRHPTVVGDLTWGANSDDAIIVAVARDGDTFIKNDKVRSSALSAKIRQCISEGAEPKVYIRADGDARYSSVKAVLDAVRSSGVKDVGFLAYQRKIVP
jgi:biopolymer transport protein TolR